MERWQKLQMIAGMDRAAWLEGVYVTPTVALKILDGITINAFFELTMYKLCKLAQGYEVNY